MTELSTRRCKPCQGGEPLGADQVQTYLHQVDDWSLDPGGKSISRNFQFKDFYQTMAFANAVAWLAHSEDHHPDLELSYKACRVRYSTHKVGGLSENDFICAARVNRLILP